MPIKTIVIIVIRMFALNWLVQGLAMLVSVAKDASGLVSLTGTLFLFVTPAAMLMVGVGLWFLAARIAGAATRRTEGSLSLGGLSRYDLYCFAFVFLGVYFVLSSLGNALNWSYNSLVIMHGTREGDPARTHAFYQLIENSVTTIAGLVAILGADRWAKKLLALEKKREERAALTYRPGEGEKG